MTAPEPHFSIVLRGYDRDEVDRYLASFFEYLATVEARAQRAEDQMAELEARTRVSRTQPMAVGEAVEEPERDWTALGERIGRILELAQEQADELRHSAEATIRAAQDWDRQRQARELEVVELTEQVRTLQQQVDVLERKRRAVLEQVGRLIGYLREAVADGPSDEASDGVVG